MPFTLFKFPTLFGRKHSSYKLGRSDLVPLPLDIESQVDPVIISHSKPSFTTFGYNSEYALEDILKSGIYDTNMEDVEKAIAKKGSKKRRPRNPFYNCEEEISSQETVQIKSDDLKTVFTINDNNNEINNNNVENEDFAVVDKDKIDDEAASVELDAVSENGVCDQKFQELYEELQTCASGGFTNFEKIYEDLTSTSGDFRSTSGSYLPPEIYKMHTESHSQRMGILTKYVDNTSYSSMASLESQGAEPIYDIWSTDETRRSTQSLDWASDGALKPSLNWCNVGAVDFEGPSFQPLVWPNSYTSNERLDFIPSKETIVMEDEKKEEGNELYANICYQKEQPTDDDSEDNYLEESDIDNEENDKDDDPIYQVPRNLNIEKTFELESEYIAPDIIKQYPLEDDKNQLYNGAISSSGAESHEDTENEEWESYNSSLEVDEDVEKHSSSTGEMNEMESDCESVDSGLETGNSNLETSENGFMEGDTDSISDGFDKPDTSGSYDLENLEHSESIYENAAVLKSTNFGKPISSTLEKYEFGQNEDARSDSLGDESNESVVFQDIEDFDKPTSEVDSKTISWGVRIGNFPQSPSPRNNNPTEDKIAKEIRELKEREDELIRLREAATTQNTPPPPSPTPSPEVPVIISQTPPKSSTAKLPGPSDKFNPSLYRPVIVPPRPRIMQDFIANGGKVTAFTQPDNTVIQLRKPQVHKSMPKVSPPVGTVRQSTGSVLDKIQAELAETKKREDELRKSRRDMFRSTPDLSKLVGKEKSNETGQMEDLDQLVDSDNEVRVASCFGLVAA